MPCIIILFYSIECILSSGPVPFSILQSYLRLSALLPTALRAPRAQESFLSPNPPVPVPLGSCPSALFSSLLLPSPFLPFLRRQRIDRAPSKFSGSSTRFCLPLPLLLCFSRFEVCPPPAAFLLPLPFSLSLSPYSVSILLLQIRHFIKIFIIISLCLPRFGPHSPFLSSLPTRLPLHNLIYRRV